MSKSGDLLQYFEDTTVIQTQYVPRWRGWRGGSSPVPDKQGEAGHGVGISLPFPFRFR